MRRAPAITLLFLAACSALFSTRVSDFSVPIENTLGQICWVRVDASGAPRVRTAAYRAQAVYDPGALALNDRVEVQFFGRPVAPASECTTRDDVTDRSLSEVLELEREVGQPIEVGGDEYGSTLGELVNHEIFWLGARAAGNVGIGERLHFEEGSVSVGF